MMSHSSHYHGRSITFSPPPSPPPLSTSLLPPLHLPPPTSPLSSLPLPPQVFFVVLLQPPSVCSSPIASTVDPDQLIPCDLMDGRDAFLTMARERHWEFSSLRRAKASTQAMLYELHNQGANFIYSCNSCGRSVETRYHCRECDVSEVSYPEVYSECDRLVFSSGL